MDGPHNIEIEQGLANIETTTIADNLSYDDKLMFSRRTQVIGIIDINNGLIKTTPHHLHIVKKSGKWVARQAQTVEVGDYLYHITDGEVLVTSVTSDTTNVYSVYKLDIEPNDIFFANGILTHNKKPGFCDPFSPEVCDPGSPCYDPCEPGGEMYGCGRDCRPM
jgi:intein/homing endonuclease